MNSEEIFNNIKNNTRTTVTKEFDPQEILKNIEADKTKDVDVNVTDQKVEPQYVDVDKPKFVQPERRSYFVAGNANNNEINTTAQRPNEIEYEADTIDDEKKKDNYFGLSKLKTNKKDIVKNALKYVVQAPNLIQNAANTIGMFTGKSGEDVALEGVRGFAGSTVDFASAMTRFFGQNYMYFKGMKDKLIDEAANIGSVLTGGEDFSDDIKQKYTDFYNKIDRQTQEFKNKTERFLQYTGIGKTDKDGFVYDLVGGAASLLYAIGATVVTKSPAAAAEVFGAYQYQSLYEEGIEKGFSPIKARSIGVAGGAAEGALELVGLHVLIETLAARKSFAKILKSAATEFIQEASQQGAEEILATTSGMRTESVSEILANVGYAGLIGALIGGGSATISNTRFVQKMISDSATKELINIGVKDEYAKQMVNSMLNFSVSPQVADEINSMLKDEQSPVTYKNADPRETYKEFGDTVKKALDPAQKRGVELEFIDEKKKFTDTVAKALINSGRFTQEEAYKQAEAQANLADGLARIGFEQDNIRPSEYYKRFKVDVTSGNIETDERNVNEDNPFVDVSFDPVDFDPQARAEYEAAMDAQQEEIDKLQKEFMMSLKDHAKFFSEIGIEAIRRPTPDGAGRDRWGEYKDLSPRIKNYFFSDDATMSWDDAEKLLAESSSNIKDLFEYLTKADETAKTYNQKEIFNKVLAKEKEAIKQQAIAGGTFLKAPNGKDSNLPEQLWLTVRTKAFKSWFGDWENSPETASKVVDENGEPKVCYHGTPLSRKQKTKNTGWYTDENGEEHYRRQEAPFNIFRGGAYNGLIFFSTDRAKAKEIANYRSMHIQDDENGNEQWTEEGYVYDVFLNSKNPLNVANKKVVNEILDSIGNIEAYDFYTNQLTKITKDEAAEILSGNNSWMVAETKQFLDAIKAQGYDALQAKDEGVEYTAVFEPTQVKSINNRGSFDRRNPDIYYQQGVQESTTEQKTKQRFDNILKATAKDLVEVKTRKEIQDKLQKMFGTYEEMDAYDEGEETDFDETSYMLANRYMADLEYAANERDYDAVQSLLDRVKKDVLEISKLKDYNNVNEEQKENNLSDTSRSGVLRTEKSAERNLYSNSTKTDLQVKDLSIQQLKEINDDIVLYLYSRKNIDEEGVYNAGFKPETIKFLKDNGIRSVDDNGIFVKLTQIKKGNDRDLYNDPDKAYRVETIEKLIDEYGYHAEELGFVKYVKEFKKQLKKLVNEQKKLNVLQEQLRNYIAKNSPQQQSQQQSQQQIQLQADMQQPMLEIFNQQQNQPRGSTTVFDRQYFINLFSTADKSTLMHEMAHAWLSEINYFASAKNATAKVLDIKKQLDNWLGVPDNNGRYSTEQQEQFAQNFEVYLKEGKAPTAKLKTVFARFKTWLSEIYDRIKDDLPKINDDVRELFDSILSRSYDVPDSNIYAGKEKAIKEVIKNIQEGKASEVDGITIDDVYNLLNMAYTRKPRKPSKNLKQLLNDKNIYDFNELNKAGADTVLQILKDGGYVKEDATAEQAVELAKKTLDGNPVYRLADQWRVAGDIDFARNLRVLEKVIEFSQIDNTLEKILSLQQEGYRNVEQSDVDKVQDEYKRLMSADVKEAKKIVEDIINRLHKKRFIDRAAQKQMIVDLNFSSTVEEIRESVLNVIEDLQDEIKLVKEQLRNPRKPVVRKDKTVPPGKNATEEEKNNYKKYMRKQINKLLKQALPRKQNQQKFSKFDVETQRFFTDLEKYNKMTIEQAQEELYKRATGIIDDEGVGLNNYEKMKNMFLSYKANKINQNTTEFYKQLYDNLMQINVFGRNTKEIEETLKKEQIQKDINSLVVNIEDNKSKNAVSTLVKKAYVLGLGNWWSTINAIAGKKQADKDSLERIEIDIFNKNYETTENLKTKCAAALGLKNATDLDMTVNRYLNEEHTYQEHDARSNTTNAVKLNKMQLICCYIWMKNETLKERIVRAYGNEQIMDMMDKLTIQDKKFGDELQQSVAALYDDVNKVYLKMYGLDMPQAQNYFPSSTERIQGNMDLLKDNIEQVSSPGFIKARVQSNLPLMNFGNPVKMALDHISKVNHFIYMQEKLADLNKVYKTTVVKRHITNAYGESIYKYIIQVMENAKFSNIAKTIDLMSNIGDYVTNNYVLSRIAIKPSIMIKQLLSCINYAEDMSSVQWFEGFLKGIRHYKKTIGFMMKNSKYCQSRFAKGGQTEALLKAMEGSNATFAKIKTFKGALSWMTRVGDIGAIIFGGYPYVMNQMSKGIPLQTAIENFEKSTIRSQQASLPSTLSNWQYRSMNQWFMRAMFAFANTPSQYCRKIGDTMYMYFHGDIDKKQMAKNLMIYGVLNSLLYTSFTSLAILSGLVSGDWDDLKDDIIMSLMQCSNVLAVPLASQGYNYALQKWVFENNSQKKEIPLLHEIYEIIDTSKKEDLEFKDWLTIVDDVASLVTGVPIKTVYNGFVGSTKDLLEGEYGKFAIKLYGATESRANKIFD